MAKEELPKEKKSKDKSKGKGKSKAASQETAVAPGARAAVLASVAAFLDSGGFPRTLAALQSEAGLEAGSWRSSPVDLDELVSKFLHSSNSTPVAVTAGSNGQDEKTDNTVAEDAAKKKKKNGDTEADESESKASEPSVPEKPSENVAGETKEKKHKKKKDVSSAGNVGSGEANETMKTDDQKLDRKKKKSKEEKDDDIEAKLDKLELAIKNKFKAAQEFNEQEPKSQNDDADKNSLGGGALDKSKKKKKKKGKLATETSERIGSEAAPAEAAGSGAVEAVKDDKDKKSKKKRKKSDPEEIAGKETISKPDDENKSGMEIEGGENGKPSSENAVAGKKRKLEEVEGSNPPAKESDTTNQSLSNGLAKDNTNENSNIKPSKKQKHSSEPRTVNAFQRVKLDDVKFADERLQDNSYWAKGGADSGYGAKAQEVLGQVKGRGFRHEKTKKKRGTYRGGQIDLQTHSIKFDNSDDE